MEGVAMMVKEAERAFGLYLSKRDFKTPMIGWAVEVLCAGGDGVATTLLAGADDEEEDEVVSLFRKAAVEQGVKLPAAGEELEWREWWACREMVAGKMTPIEGMNALYWIWRDSFSDNQSDRRFVRWDYLSESIVVLEDGFHGIDPFEDLTLETVDETILAEARAVMARWK